MILRTFLGAIVSLLFSAGAFANTITFNFDVNIGTGTKPYAVYFAAWTNYNEQAQGYGKVLSRSSDGTLTFVQSNSTNQQASPQVIPCFKIGNDVANGDAVSLQFDDGQSYAGGVGYFFVAPSGPETPVCMPTTPGNGWFNVAPTDAAKLAAPGIYWNNGTSNTNPAISDVTSNIIPPYAFTEFSASKYDSIKSPKPELDIDSSQVDMVSFPINVKAGVVDTSKIPPPGTQGVGNNTDATTRDNLFASFVGEFSGSQISWSSLEQLINPPTSPTNPDFRIIPNQSIVLNTGK